MLADLDDTVRQLLIRQVPADPAEIDVSFDAPDRDWSARLSRPSINCFLYDVIENRDLHQGGWDVTKRANTATRSQRPIRVNATYQVSTWARAPEDEHRLLSRVMATLIRNPELPGDMLQGSLVYQPFPVIAKVMQPEQAPKNLTDLWQALDNRIRPSLTYVVTLALDPELVISSPLVLTSTLRMRDSQQELAGEHTFIGGRVRSRVDHARGIADAWVGLRETGAETVTDGEGRFSFARGPRGPLTVVVKIAGRPDVEQQIIVPSENYDVDV